MSTNISDDEYGVTATGGRPATIIIRGIKLKVRGRPLADRGAVRRRRPDARRGGERDTVRGAAVHLGVRIRRLRLRAGTRPRDEPGCGQSGALPTVRGGSWSGGARRDDGGTIPSLPGRNACSRSWTRRGPSTMSEEHAVPKRLHCSNFHY